VPFSYDSSQLSSNPVMRVRLHLGDKFVAPDGPWPGGSNFDDAEVAELLLLEGNNVMRAVAAGCEALANSWAALVSAHTGGIGDSTSDISKAFALRGEKLRQQYGGAMLTVSVAFKRADGYAQMGATDPNLGSSLSEYYKARQRVRYGW
jgi:hypothetical protein